MKKNGQFVGIDEEFIPEEEKYVDESLLGDKQKTKKALKTVGIGYLVLVVIVLVFAATIIVIAFSNMFKARKTAADIISNIGKTEIMENMGDIVNNTVESMKENNNSIEDIQNGMMNAVQGFMENNPFAAEQFNSTLEAYSGKVSKFFVENAISEISTINNKGERSITIKFEGKEITDNAGIKTLLKNLTEKEYYITYEYDDNGYIKAATIEKL